VSPFGWLWIHTDGAVIHSGKVLAGKAFGWLAPRGAHAAGGGAKLLLSHLSLSQLLGVLLAVLALLWQMVLGAFPGLGAQVHSLIHPSAFTPCPAVPPVGGAVGIGYKLGADLRLLTGKPPSAQQIHDGLVGAFTTAGEVVGAFTAAAHGATAPLDPAGVPPAQQVGLTSCCAPPGGTTPAGSSDTTAVVAARATLAAGFTGADAMTAMEVAGAESGYVATAANPGSTARGLYQIMLSAHPGLLPGSSWSDPYANARAAKTVHDNARGWTPWATYTNGAYLQWQTAAAQALAKAQGQYGPFLPVSAPTVPAATCTPGRPITTNGPIVFPLQNPAVAVGVSQWTEDQGVDVATIGHAAGAQAVLVAVASGTIVREGIAGFGPAAPSLLIDSGPLIGRTVYYGHALPALVPVGAHVVAGQPIAEVGAGIVGNSSGPHLEIGISVVGSQSVPPDHATSSEMLRLLLSALPGQPTV